jgi:hypothetical protein
VHHAASAALQPVPDRQNVADVTKDVGKYDVRNRLLLTAQMVFQQLVTRDVARIHALDGMVHQKLGIDIRDARNSCKRPVTLTQIISPF